MPDPARITEPPPSLAERIKQHAKDAAPVDTGAIPRYLAETAEEAEERRARAQAHRLARWEQRRPLMYADAELADVGDPQVAGWLNRPESFTLVLAGPVGVGKTHAAYAIGNAAVAVGRWAEAFTVPDLLAALRPDGEGAPGVRECDLLVVDDLSAQTPSAWAQETLTAIIDARLREGRRQIVTTNAPYDALVESWGDRLMDRLAYRMVAATMTGESRRRAAW